LKKANAFLRGLLASYVAASVALFAIVWLSVQQSRKSHEERAATAAENLSQLLARNITGMIRRVDLALQATADEIERQAAHGGISRDAIDGFIANQLKRMPELDQLRFADEKGVIRYGTEVLIGSAVNVADRDYFTRLRDDPDIGLFVSKPLNSPPSGKWAVVLARRCSKPDGSFGGVIYGDVMLSQFREIFNQLALGARGAVSMRDLDLGLIVRHPLPTGLNSEIGNRTVSPEFRESLRLLPERGSYIAPTGLDGINRTVSYRRMSVYPAYIIVGLATEDYLAEWQADTRKLLLVVVLLGLAGSGMWWALSKSWKRQEAYETRLHALFDASPDVQLICDEKGTITHANRQVEHLLGYKVEELIGRSIDLLVPERSRAAHPGLRARFAVSPASRRMGQRLGVKACRKDGSACDVDVSLSRIYTGQGFLFVSALRDITERKAAEADLRIAAIAFEVMEGMVVTDANGIVLRINRAFTKITGYSPDEAIGRKMNLLRSHRHDANFYAEMWAAVIGLGSWQGEIWNRDKNGEVHPHWLTVTAVKGSDYSFTHYVGVYTDFTERKRTEEELGLMAKVFTHSGEGIVITDARSRIVKVNTAFTRLTGYTEQEVLGADPKILSVGITADDVYRQMWSSLNSQGTWSGEIWDRRKSGEIYPKWLSIVTVRNPSGDATNYIGSFSDISERKAAETRIHFMANHDALTQLPNRMNLHERLAQVVNLARRNDTKAALMMIDLDHFKVINDTLGHHVGDQLLIEVARRLMQAVREADIVARLGGDEFVIVLSVIDCMSDAANVAEKILRTVSAPYQIGGHELRTSPSIGICLFPDDAVETGDLIKYADVAMYAAKAKGGQGHQFFSPMMHVAATSRMIMESELRIAIEKRQFVLHYQPQLDLRTGCLVGVEALIRWQHPGRGLIAPMDFISIAEETGLIAAIGEWVLHEACRQLKEWQDKGIRHIRMSVNLSPIQFLDKGLPDQVQSALALAGLSPDSLDLEVTESMAMNSPADTIETLNLLADSGINLSMDDFGTGYSSLAYLKLFPLHVLKIDRSFVKDIETDPDDADICDVIVLLAHKLGLEVIAEGVETEAQLKFLVSIGCEKIQGYLLSKPLPAGLAADFILGHTPGLAVSRIDIWRA
jgi:diguanylate cyclase (GGDEF)-like protein/PAS domain S-box-containing protein